MIPVKFQLGTTVRFKKSNFIGQVISVSLDGEHGVVYTVWFHEPRVRLFKIKEDDLSATSNKE